MYEIGWRGASSGMIFWHNPNFNDDRELATFDDRSREHLRNLSSDQLFMCLGQLSCY